MYASINIRVSTLGFLAIGRGLSMVQRRREAGGLRWLRVRDRSNR